MILLKGCLTRGAMHIQVRQSFLLFIELFFRSYLPDIEEANHFFLQRSERSQRRSSEGNGTIVEKRSGRLYQRIYSLEEWNPIYPGITAIVATSVPEAAARRF
ncbi:hypothetical protein [Paenibacillus silvae]|uniref:Uncharacterized protein n=1 Tax=Paenibacillus silvae TaxID=1325358 RepID=A0A2W6QHT3_9BACL|nr:hypothetical protein [Paenibacillus silvae]PZT56723.1 hypothetical protein DN757_05590 [Paenibacillus silvae]